MFKYMTDDDFERNRKYRFNAGIIQDKKEHSHTVINRLYEILLNEGHLEKFSKAVGDEKYRNRLLYEYRLIID